MPISGTALRRPPESTAPEQEIPTALAEPLAGPALLDLPAGMPAGPVDHGLTGTRARPRASTPGALGPIAIGLAILLLGWFALSAAGFVADQFTRSDAAGWSAVAMLAAGLLAVLWGVRREVGAFRRLKEVEALRALLREDDGPVQPARSLALAWLDGLADLPGTAEAREAVTTATDIPLLRAGLRRHLAGPLLQATRRAGDRAALEGGAVVAISPSPALDGLLAGLRGLSLLRQIAALHGMRPGGAVILTLLRRLVWTAASTSGLDLLSQSLADSALTHLPGLRPLAAALPGSGLAALRLKRLADITARACSPLEAG
jgi:putative membrane protein